MKDDLRETVISIPHWLFKKSEKQVIISPKFIKVEIPGLKGHYKTILKSHIEEFRYGMEWIRGISRFTIGRYYQIYLKDSGNRSVKIGFKVYYGIRKKEYHDIYADLVNSIIKYYFTDKIYDLLEKFENGQDFSIGEVYFTKRDITIKSGATLKARELTIPWEKVSTRDYQTYFAIFSIEDPSKINRGYSYLKDWNTVVLYSVVKNILSRVDKSKNN